MKFLNKHQNIAILILTLLLAVEIEICHAKITKLEGYHSRLKKKQKTSNFEVERKSKPNNLGIFDKFRFKSSMNSKEGEDNNDFVTNSYITDTAKVASSISDNETEIIPKFASAGSEYSWGFLFWSFLNFGANNALSGHHGYWLSKRNVIHDHWKVEFDDIKKIDTVQIIWRLPPTRFKIFYKLDKKTDWIPATEAYSKLNIKDRQGKVVSRENTSNFNTVYFKKPLFCKELKIMLNEPIKRKSFSINKVNFYTKNSKGLFQSAIKNENQINYCLFVNTDKPRELTTVDVYPCIDAIANGMGNELFEIRTNGLIKMLTKDLCIGYIEKTREIVLRECFDQRSAFIINYDKDSTMYFTSLKNTNIFVDTKKQPNYINEKVEIITSSEMDETIHSKRNILTTGNQFWASSPGQRDVSIQFLFGKVNCNNCKEMNTFEKKKIDNIKIQFVHPARKFNVFIWNPGQSWKNIASFDENNERIINITIVNETAAALMIRMTEGFQVQEFGNEVVYAISNLDITSNGYLLKYDEKTSQPSENKIFEFIHQEFTSNTGFGDLKDSVEKLSKTQEKITAGYKLLRSNMPLMEKIKIQAREHCSKVVGFRNLIGNQTLKSLTNFKERDLYNISSDRFINFLVKFSEQKFYSSITGGKSDLNQYKRNSSRNMIIPLDNMKSLFANFSNKYKKSIFNLAYLIKAQNEKSSNENINDSDKQTESKTNKFSFKSLNSANKENEGEEKTLKRLPKIGEQENPAESCLEMRLLIPNILSGFYYIQPECTNRPLRVFCDFSLYNEAVDFYIFKDDLPLPNPDLSYLKIKRDDDVKFQCAKKGLYPIEINNHDMLKRIYDLLILDGYNLTSANFVPLGYDFTCKNNRCSKIYNSLNNRRSKPLNTFIKGKIESTENGGRFMGYGSQGEKIISFNPDKSTITGLICSTNKFAKSSNEKQIIQASCELNTSQNSSIFNNNNDYIVKCPIDCNLSSPLIYGTGIYHGDSSICKAAIHAGVISSTGGKLILNLQNPQSDYNGNTDFGISSLNKNGDGIKAFIVRKFTPKCPMDSFKHLLNKNKRSFIEASNESSETLTNITDDNLDEKLKTLDNEPTSLGETIETQKYSSDNNDSENYRFKEKSSVEKSETNSENKEKSEVKNSNENNNKISKVENEKKTEKGFLDSVMPSLGQTADTMASGGMNALNAGVGLISSLMGGKPPADYLKFGRRDDRMLGASLNPLTGNPIDPLSGLQGNNGNSAPESDATNQHNTSESSITDPNYALFNGKKTAGQYGPNGMWTPQSFMGNPQKSIDPVLSISNPNFDPISLSIKAAQSQNPQESTVSSNPGSESNSGSGGLSNFLNNNTANQLDLSNPVIKAQMFDKFENYSEQQSQLAASSSKKNTGGARGSSSSLSYGQKPLSTLKTFDIIKKIFNSSLMSYLEKIGEKNKLIKQFVSKFKGNLSSCMASGLGDCKVENLESQIKKLIELKFKINRIILKLQFAAKARVEKTDRLKRSWKNSLMELNSRDKFELNLTSFKSMTAAKEYIFTKVFNTLRNPDNLEEGSKGGIKDWTIFNRDIKSKTHAIGIFSNLTSTKNLAASLLQIKGKDYYDFNLKVEVLFKAEGIAGIAFRIQNEFNYYAFVIDKISGYKALVKVVNSEVSIIKSINDGGILIGNWHTVTIKTQGSRISAYIYDSESASKTSSEKTIEIEDSTFIHGSIGIFINNIKGFLFEGLEIEPLKCWSPWMPKKDLKILNSDTNIYEEDFYSSFEEKYIRVDLDDSELHDGPAQWALVSDYIESSHIVQSKLTYDSSPKRKPNIALIKNKNFQNGIIKMQLEAIEGQSGFISVIFKYSKVNNLEQFYSFDLVNDEKQSYFALRRYKAEEFKVLKQKIISQKESNIFPNKKAFKLSNKIDILIESINDKILIKLSYDGSNYHDVMALVDDSIKNGLVGFGTWKTAVKFYTINLEPPKIHLTTKDIDTLSKSDNTDLPLPSVNEIAKAVKSSNCVNKNIGNENPIGTINSIISVLNSALGKDYCDSSNQKANEKKDQDSDNNGSLNKNSQMGDKSNPAENELGKISKKDEDFISKGSWKACVSSRSEDMREKYCSAKSTSEIAIEKCKNNFCDVCCQDNVLDIHNNLMHNCKKGCYKSTISVSTSKEYESICINSTNPTDNVYEFCEKKMNYDNSLVQYCKLDMCNLCCVTMDSIKKKSFSFDNLKQCFKGCNKEFNVYGITVGKLVTSSKDESKKELDFQDFFNAEEYVAMPKFRNEIVHQTEKTNEQTDKGQNIIAEANNKEISNENGNQINGNASNQGIQN